MINRKGSNNDLQNPTQTRDLARRAPLRYENKI
jgi:hypothetical protein